MQCSYDRLSLTGFLPQKPPFLFLDSASWRGEHAEGAYTITGEEAIGHFAGNPVFPASLMMEALGQLACVWLLSAIEAEQGPEIRERLRLFFVGAERIKCRRICVPGDLLEMVIEPTKVRQPLAYFFGRIQVGNQKVASCEALTLSFLDEAGEVTGPVLAH